MSKATKSGDAGNTGFDFPENILRHKPGFELGEAAREPEADGDHRFRRSDPKKVPQISLAERIAKSLKGEK
jgi:hypothetical protein